MPRKRHDHAWLTFAFALDRIEVYYCGYCLYTNFILLVLGTLIFWLFSFIIALLFPGYITSVSDNIHPDDHFSRYHADKL